MLIAFMLPKVGFEGVANNEVQVGDEEKVQVCIRNELLEFECIRTQPYVRSADF